MTMVYLFSPFLLLNTNKNQKISDNQLAGLGKRQTCTRGLCRDVSLQYTIPGIESKWAISMNSLVHWFGVNASVLAVLVTVGVAVLLICCLECSNCSSREKDELFHRNEL
jgi:hypothetical protein